MPAEVERFHGLQQIRAAPECADARSAANLGGGESEKVTAPTPGRELAVGRSLGRVDDDDRSPLMRPCAQLFDGVDCASGGDEAGRNDFDVTAVLEIVERSEVQLAVSSSRDHLEVRTRSLRDGLPRDEVGRCSSSVTRTTSPGRVGETQAYATSLRPSVALRVNHLTSFRRVMNGADLMASPFEAAVARSESGIRRGARFRTSLVELIHGFEHLTRLLIRHRRVQVTSGSLDSCSKSGSPLEDGCVELSPGSL